jgi:hypothetical protein
MPETKKALDEGEVSLAAAKLLVAAREVDPEAFSRCEPELVEAARVHQVRDLQRVTSEWRQMAERERVMSGEEALRETRRLHASPTFGGMVRVDGDLDPETGETLLTALRAVMDAEARSGGEDFRSPAQRRAVALGEVCRQWLDRTDRPQVGGERPHVTITVGLADLRELQGSAELDHTGPVPVEVARRIACDASIVRAVMAGPSEPLDLGRRTPLVSAAQRRAVILRDRSCRFPGCDRPPVWCDAHHIVHWEDGGPTDLCNLILLCRPPHAATRPGRVHPSGRGRTAGVQEAGRLRVGRRLRAGAAPRRLKVDAGELPRCRTRYQTRPLQPFSRAPVQPIAPSICSSISRFSSTAYSIGNSRVIGSMNPLTTIAVASASVSPRLIR